jgi:hypothetical protein
MKNESETTPMKPPVPKLATAPPSDAELLRKVHALNEAVMNATTQVSEPHEKTRTKHTNLAVALKSKPTAPPTLLFPVAESATFP